LGISKKEFIEVLGIIEEFLKFLGFFMSLGIYRVLLIFQEFGKNIRSVSKSSINPSSSSKNLIHIM
jgi:hypothetical protein